MSDVFYGLKRTDLTNLIDKYLGRSGRMIAGSKSMYRKNHPKSIVYFNACIFDESLVQIWWGDIDLTLDSEKLKKIENESGQSFYVTPEHPYRSDFREVSLTKKGMDEDELVIKFNHRSKKHDVHT